MKIEVLFPEQCNIFGESFNIKYLQKCSDKIKVYYTSINETPKFVKEEIDMIYLGSMPYKHQEIIIKKLKPHVKRLKELIEKNKIVLFTGDAIEILGKYIYDLDTDKKQDGLNLFDIYFERSFYKRYNYFFLGNYKKIKIVGSVSTFSRMYGKEDNPFIKITKGLGMNNKNELEGINYKNFFATYLIGPLLILNPKFTEMILSKLGCEKNLYLKKEIYNAYNHRLKELENDKVKIVMGEHG